jgi:L-fuconolactonase
MSTRSHHPLFDTHAHLIADDWQAYPPKSLRVDLPTPKRTDYTVTAEALIKMMDEHTVPTACVVQRGHLYGYDNSYIIDSAKKFPDRLLPVVILDTQDVNTPAQVMDMVKNSQVRGFRMANTRPSHLDTAWMSSPTAMQVWQTCADLHVPMTLIFFHNQLPYVLPLLRIIAKRFANLPILIDHLGTAYGATHVELAWAKESGSNQFGTSQAIVMPPPPNFGIDETIKIFQDTPNVYFKFTEVNIERLHEVAIEPARLIRKMADTFGAERLVWGSDIGQSLRWSYADKTSMGRAATDLLSNAECAMFLHDNAARIYSKR